MPVRRAVIIKYYFLVYEIEVENLLYLTQILPKSYKVFLA